MGDIVHAYQRTRREFGRQCKFDDRHAQLCVDVEPEPELRENYIKRSPCDAVSGNYVEYSVHECNTERKEYADKGMNHWAGGWPRDVDPADVDQTQRFLKKVNKDPEYVKTVQTLGEPVVHCLRQNASVDIYEDFFPTESEHSRVEAPSAKTTNLFRDPSGDNRSVNAMSWYPDSNQKLACAYSIFEFQKGVGTTSMKSYVWDVENPTDPDFTMDPSSPLVTLQYNPKDANIILGGQYNGQVAMWDVRKGSRPVTTTPVEACHIDPVHCVKYTSSKTGTECFSVSTDGRVLWWDTRNLASPTDTLDIDVGQGKLGGTCLEFESTMPTKFMIGTETGVVVGGNRKAKNPSERIIGTYAGHHGAIVGLERNPFVPKYFMSVGDWCSRVWSEDIKESSVLWSKYHDCYLTCGGWSGGRPGVAFTGREDGIVDIWDHTVRTPGPCLSVQVSDSAVSSLANDSSGRILAVGAHDGSVTILELNDNLAIMRQGEKGIVSEIFERESSREKIVVARLRELNLKKRSRSARVQMSSAKSSKSDKGEEEEEEEDPIKVAEETFWDSLKETAAKKEKAATKAAEAASKQQ